MTEEKNNEVTAEIIAEESGKEFESEKHEYWIASLLNGLEELPLLGKPGRVVVFGDKAEAVLTAEHEEDVLVAAASCGQGRAVIISQDSYVANLYYLLTNPTAESGEPVEKLMRNVIKWLTRQKDSSSLRFVYLHGTGYEKRHLMKSDLAVWTGGGLGSLTCDDVLEFVHNGGGLLHAATPWGWMQNNPDLTLDQMPYFQVLEELGLCYSECDMNETAKTTIKISENKAKLSHLTRTLNDEAITQNTGLAGLFRAIADIPKEKISEELILQIKNAFKLATDQVEESVPSEEAPVESDTGKEMLDLWQAGMDVQELSIKAPGTSKFPGDFPKDIILPLCSETLSFESKVEDFHSTGLYAPAGEIVIVNIESGNEYKDWTLIIGAHQDELEEGSFKRWPKLCVKAKLQEATHRICSPFGGLVYLESPDYLCSIKVNFQNVVQAPQFNMTNAEDAIVLWKTRRNAIGLWADLIGKYIMFTMPSESVRHLENPGDSLEVWDEVVKHYHYLRGTVADDHRREWVVTDLQVKFGGYMHCGYPIVTHLDLAQPHDSENASKFPLNRQKLKDEGYWGLFHEIGHNMQRDEWTFEGTGEVTVNIFVLAAMHHVCGQEPWIHEWLKPHIEKCKDYIKIDPDFEIWKKNPGMALIIYAQLARDFGWSCYRRVFSRYEVLKPEDKPQNDQDKIDMWFKFFSEEASYNLTPLAEFWGIPISGVVKEKLKILSSFFPADSLTDSYLVESEHILKRYPDAVRKP